MWASTPTKRRRKSVHHEAAAQGKVISMGNRGGTVRDLDGRALTVYPVSRTTYGEPDGLWGINCHHKPPNVFVPGVSQIRGTVPDKAGNDQRYEQSQRQRRLEREVRYAKRDAAMMDAAGDREGFDEAAIRVKRATKELKGFAEANGLQVYGDRTQVFGYNWSVAGKAVESVRAREAAEKAATELETLYEEAQKASGIKGKLQKPIIPEDIDGYLFDDAHINGERGHGVTKEEAISFVRNAVVTVSRKNSPNTNFYSPEGAAYINLKKNKIRTSFHSSEYMPDVKKMMEVIMDAMAKR